MRKTFNLRKFLAFGVSSMALAIGCGQGALADPVDFIISAPLPTGQTYSPSGSQFVGPAIIGNATGESGTLAIEFGQALTSGIDQGRGSVVGNASGSFGTVTVGGLDAMWYDIGTATVIGQNGAATLRISETGYVYVQYLQMANGTGGTADVTVSGSGSVLKSELGAYLADGDGATGTLAITDGGTFETVAGGFYMFDGGTVTASGAGSQIRIGTKRDNSTSISWDPKDSNGPDGWFYMSGGKATVSAGASVDTDGLYVAGTAGHDASFLLTGQGTTLVSHLPIFVGSDGNGPTGNGTLIISDGATAVGSTVWAGGSDVTKQGLIWVTGAGSSLSSVANGSFHGNISVGDVGMGTLIVDNGASVSAQGKLKIGLSPSDQARVIIGGTGTPVAPGSVTANEGVVFGAVNGELIFNHTSANYVFGSNFLDPKTLDSHYGRGGRILALNGVTHLTGDTSAFNCDVVIGSNATLSVEQGFGAGVVLSVYGTASGGTGAIDLLGNSNTVNVYNSARFLSPIDYHNTRYNTLNFYTGSYTLPVANYALANNTINLLGTAKHLITSDLNNAGTGNIVLADVSGTSSLGKASSDMQNQVSGVIGDIMSLDMARPGNISAPTAYAPEAKPRPNPTDIQVKGSADQALSFDAYGNLFWLRGFAGGRHQEASGDVQGSNARQFGSLAGVDHLFNDWRIGLYGGGGRSTNDLAEGMGSLSADMAIAGVYGRRDFGALALDMALTGGHLWADTTRTINGGAETASADFGGWFVAPELALSTKYALGQNWSLTPSLKGRYVATFFDGYSETGSSQDIRYDSHTTQSLEEKFDLKLAYQTVSASGLAARYWLGGGVSAQQRMGDGAYGATLSGADFTVATVGDANVYGGTVSLGFDVMVAENVSLFGNLEGSLFSDNSRTGMARGGVKVAF